jgi:hypothetical protein
MRRHRGSNHCKAVYSIQNSETARADAFSTGKEYLGVVFNTVDMMIYGMERKREKQLTKQNKTQGEI